MPRLLHWPGNIPLFSEVALVAMLAWLVAGWLLPSNSPIPSTLTPNITSKTAALPDLSKLITVPLFGKINVPVLPSTTLVPVAKPIALSQLKIKLLGTVVSETHAAAIIALAAGREQRAFFIGDSIQPGVILKKVEAEAIVVDRGGKLERISLEKATPLVAVPFPASGINTTPVTLPTHRLSPPPMPAYIPSGAMRRNINRQHLQQQLKDFPALLSQARVIPRMVNGKPSGFTISEIAPGSLYQQAGLRNGDIILSVNGKRIADARQAMTMYQTLKSAPSLDLVLIRAGQTQQVHYDIR